MVSVPLQHTAKFENMKKNFQQNSNSQSSYGFSLCRILHQSPPSLEFCCQQFLFLVQAELIAGCINGSTLTFTSMGIKCLTLLLSKFTVSTTRTIATLTWPSLPGSNSFTIPNFHSTLLVESL